MITEDPLEQGRDDAESGEGGRDLLPFGCRGGSAIEGSNEKAPGPPSSIFAGFRISKGSSPRRKKVNCGAHRDAATRILRRDATATLLGRSNIERQTSNIEGKMRVPWLLFEIRRPGFAFLGDLCASAVNS